MSDETVNEDYKIIEGQDVVSAKGAAKILGMHVETFLELPVDRISAVYSRTQKQTKELGLPPKDSADNEEWFLVEEVERLKTELEQQKDQAKQGIDPQSAP